MKAMKDMEVRTFVGFRAPRPLGWGVPSGCTGCRRLELIGEVGVVVELSSLSPEKDAWLIP